MGVINLGLLVDKIKRKLENSGFIKNTDYASASAAGVVKVGTGLSITDAGVLSASSAGFTVDTIYSGSNESTNTFTFPTGKTLASYTFILLVVESSGEDHDCISTLIPAAWVTASEVVYTTLNYDATYKIKVKIEPDKVTKYSGYTTYYINKVYAF